MRPGQVVLLGDADDARGFRLAGVTALACRTAADVLGALRHVTRSDRDRADIVLVSDAVYRLAPEHVDAVSVGGEGPMVLVVPVTDGEPR